MTPELRFPLSPGEAGVSECLAAMAAIVRLCPVLRTVGTGARVMETAARLRAASSTPAVYMDKVYNFLRANVAFTPDPPFTELVRHPDQLLQTAAEKGKARCDCDEVATLGASLLLAQGIEPAFIVVGRPGHLDTAGRVKLSHVFYGAVLGRSSVRTTVGAQVTTGMVRPFDPQERIPAGTWPPPRAIGRMERYDILPRKSRAA